MVEQVMLDDEMAVSIAQRASIGILFVNFVAAIVLARQLLRSEKDIVVISLRAQRTGLRFIIPLLNEQHTGFGIGMGLETVGMQADHGKNATPFHNVVTEPLIAGVVETPLRQHHRHATAGLQHIEVALDKQ